GIPGEIYIGGMGLAKGYLNRPDLTDERFIIKTAEDTENAERLYRTGDLGCYLSDGNIQFLGRRDDQVKIRGFRIELGEIESVLNQHEAIQEAVVIASQDESNLKRLMAYFVGNVSADQLREYLTEKLPDYMIPALFIPLESFPLTPSGKVNRRALPTPNLTEMATNAIASFTPIEEILAGIWSQVLGIPTVQSNDNFFTLGGHSLLATQVISRIRNAFKIELPLRSLFETPTLAGLARQVETAMQRGVSQSLPPVQSVTRPNTIPLSFAQQRLWFLEQVVSGSASYHLPFGVRLRGNLNIDVLEQTFQALIARHETLRTTFQTIQGQPCQVIAESVAFKLPIIDLQDLSKVEQKAKLEEIAKTEAQRPFDFTQSPLMRVTLLRLSNIESVVLLTMHHIISDGWSMGVLVKELGTLYTALIQGETSPLPPLSVQYADFALWQRQSLAGEVLTSQLDYWKAQLKDAATVLELPTDHPRPAVSTVVGDTRSLLIPKKITQALKALSQQQGVTLFITLLAAFQTLLYRYSGQTDILVGSPVANRNREELESIIGFFVNTLVLRTDLSGNPSFAELLERVRNVALGAYAHQDVPFEQVVEAVQPERSLSHTPLFQVMFVLQNTPQEVLTLPEIELQGFESNRGVANFDLTLSLTETEKGLQGSLEYNTDLFNASTIERMIGHFQVLLEGILANSQQSISQLPLLTPPEIAQLQEWNATESRFADSLCIHQLFEAQVEKTPNAVAVMSDSATLQYAELNAKANQLAHHLQSLGVKSETLVGLCVARSPEMLIGMLAILKAGGAYVPLDPHYPSQRLSLIMEDAQVPVLITQEHLLPSLPQSNATVVCVDRDWETIAEFPSENLPCQTQPNNLAYLIYTSGSTGKPKGVMIEHRSLVNYIQSVQRSYEVTENDRVLQFASINFDASAEEIYTPLISGATLVLRTEEMLSSMGQFLQQCQVWDITVLSLPTAFWHELVKQLETLTLPPSLRLVVIGGEAALIERVKQWHSSSHGVRLLNAYGPTESTIGATLCELVPELEISPIGKPLNNVQVHLLDANLQPIPVGIPGEIYLGGLGLARGYLNRPDLTAERFVIKTAEDTENTEEGEGERLYRTGDLGRYLPDGNIEFLGRIDSQVKLRGFRIELGEIEAALREHLMVQDAIALLQGYSSENKRLVAYVVSDQIADELVISLRNWLKERLPSYMIPAAFSVLKQFPLNANGKVDKRALPLLKVEQQRIYIQPANEIEKTLAEIWKAVLNLDAVSVNDNFFDLGGHSLLLMQIHSQLQEKLQIEVSLLDFYQHPTIRTLAEYLSNKKEPPKPKNSDRTEKLQGGKARLQKRLQARQQAKRNR
ncbi:MAG: amino acid adenylation domain-containing protein, partial [Chroococcales cyanobacterium]